jgi:hypothetical protein
MAGHSARASACVACVLCGGTTRHVALCLEGSIIMGVTLQPQSHSLLHRLLLVCPARTVGTLMSSCIAGRTEASFLTGFKGMRQAAWCSLYGDWMQHSLDGLQYAVALRVRCMSRALYCVWAVQLSCCRVGICRVISSIVVLVTSSAL